MIDVYCWGFYLDAVSCSPPRAGKKSTEKFNSRFVCSSKNRLGEATNWWVTSMELVFRILWDFSIDLSIYHRNEILELNSRKTRKKPVGRA